MYKEHQVTFLTKSESKLRSEVLKHPKAGVPGHHWICWSFHRTTTYFTWSIHLQRNNRQHYWSKHRHPKLTIWGIDQILMIYITVSSEKRLPKDSLEKSSSFPLQFEWCLLHYWSFQLSSAYCNCPLDYFWPWNQHYWPLKMAGVIGRVFDCVLSHWRGKYICVCGSTLPLSTTVFMLQIVKPICSQPPCWFMWSYLKMPECKLFHYQQETSGTNFSLTGGKVMDGSKQCNKKV